MHQKYILWCVLKVLLEGWYPASNKSVLPPPQTLEKNIFGAELILQINPKGWSLYLRTSNPSTIYHSESERHLNWILMQNLVNLPGHSIGEHPSRDKECNAVPEEDLQINSHMVYLVYIKPWGSLHITAETLGDVML